MPQTFRVALAEGGPGPPWFPEACVCCGGAPTEESRLVFDRLLLRGDQQVRVERTIGIPHCLACTKATKVFFLASVVPLVGGFVAFGGLALLLTTIGASALGWDDIGQPRVTPNSMVVGGAVGLAAGSVGGALAEIAVRILLFPIYGLGLLRAPLLTTQFFSGADFVAGLKASASRDFTSLTLEFSNDEIAERFAARNPGATRALPRRGER